MQPVHTGRPIVIVIYSASVHESAFHIQKERIERSATGLAMATGDRRRSYVFISLLYVRAKSSFVTRDVIMNNDICTIYTHTEYDSMYVFFLLLHVDMDELRYCGSKTVYISCENKNKRKCDVANWRRLAILSLPPPPPPLRLSLLLARSIYHFYFSIDDC